MVHVRAGDAKTAHVDAVEAEYREPRGEAAGREPPYELEDFLHVERVRELVRRLVTPVPVVEIAGDDERRVGRNEPFDALAQTLDLAAATARREREVHAHAVQRHVPAGDVDLTVQEPAFFETVRGDVLVIPTPDREARQDRV